MTATFCDRRPHTQSKSFEKRRLWAQHLCRRLASLLRCEKGVSVLEFGLIAPVLALGLFYIGSFGVDLHRQMDLEQVLRAGASAAVDDVGGPEVLARMEAIATAKGYSVYKGPTPVPLDELVITASRTCTCPDALHMSFVCNVTCGDGRPAIVKYVLSVLHGSGHVNRMLYKILEMKGTSRVFPQSGVLGIKTVLVR